MTITIYGIKNCDTVRKARQWLEANGVKHRFHDFRIDGLDEATLTRWCSALGWEKLLNKASATFRDLSATDKDGMDAGRAMALMLAHPTLVKRPVLDADGRLLTGFRPELYEKFIAPGM